MKTMKNTMRSLVAVFMMAMAFVITGITAEAANATVVNDVYNAPTPTIYTVNFAAGQTEVVQTMPVPSKGAILMYAAANTDATIEVYNGFTKVGYSMYLYDDGTIDDNTYVFTGATTATLKFTRSSYDAEAAGMVQFYAFFINSGNSSVAAKKTTAYYSQDSNEYSYTKISVKKTGYLKVETPGDYSVYVTLCNSKKKAVSDELYAYSSSPVNYFAVTKGTYYIRTRATSSNLYNVKYSFTQVKEKSGSKQSKAVTIKKNKTIKGVLTANNKSQTDWYKIKMTKKQVLKLTLKSLHTGSYGDIKVQVIPANKNMKIYGDTVRLSSTTQTQTAKSTGKWNAGTYYLKVTKGDKKASGYYTIKWK